jgi:lipid A ethanolaminephosphotransferase
MTEKDVRTGPIGAGWFSWASNIHGRLRREVGAARFIMVIALVNAVVYQKPLYSFAIANLDLRSANGFLTFVTMFVLVFAITAVILSLLTLLTHRLLKPVCMLLAVGNSVAVYFVTTYRVILDMSMMGNVYNTDRAEAASYFHPMLLLYVFILGVVPCWLLAHVRVRKTPRLRVAALGLTTCIAALGWNYVASSTWLWFDDHAKRLGGMVMPWSYVGNTVRLQLAYLRSNRQAILLPPASFESDDKMVVVLVIGEAARSENFSLYGYDRPTNPLLSESGAIALKDTIACSTYTTASLRCILSPEDTSSPFAKNLEPLPSYLYRYGADVVWRARNWGEPPLHVTDYQRVGELKAICNRTDCDYDGALLAGLSERIESSTQNKIFVVLHQKGSHGPSYNAEYPRRFQVFKPVCDSVELQKCTHESLLNAYDNTILYNDYFLNEVIRLLSNMGDTPTLMMYISDHGESLGEYGLYLHGTPFSIAPDVQKDVPFIVWMSPAFIAQKGISVARIEAQAHHSQLDVFHSVLGAFGVRSDVYDSRLDIFSDAYID